ncbi:MAG: hypothetical protein Q9169_000230 [Polycauliona sp. 2 TL-2023]
MPYYPPSDYYTTYPQSYYDSYTGRVHYEDDHLESYEAIHHDYLGPTHYEDGAPIAPPTVCHGGCIITTHRIPRNGLPQGTTLGNWFQIAKDEGICITHIGGGCWDGGDCDKFYRDNVCRTLLSLGYNDQDYRCRRQMMRVAAGLPAGPPDRGVQQKGNLDRELEEMSIEAIPSTMGAAHPVDTTIHQLAKGGVNTLLSKKDTTTMWMSLVPPWDVIRKTTAMEPHLEDQARVRSIPMMLRNRKTSRSHVPPQISTIVLRAVATLQKTMQLHVQPQVRTDVLSVVLTLRQLDPPAADIINAWNDVPPPKNAMPSMTTAACQDDTLLDNASPLKGHVLAALRKDATLLAAARVNDILPKNVAPSKDRVPAAHRNNVIPPAAAGVDLQAA